VSAGRACVIGGTSGIGLAVAGALRADGTAVTVVGRDADRGRRAAAEIGADYLRADCADADQVADLVRAMDDVPTRLVVSGGGTELVSRPAPLTPPADLPTAFALQFTGRVLPVLAFAPLMAERGYGKIVVVSTVAGLAPSRRQWLVGSMAAAAQHACRSLAAEFAAAGVRVNAVALTMVRGSGFDTRMRAGDLDPAVSAMMDTVAARLPLGPPALADAVGVILTLLRPESDAITGSVVALTGGLVR